MPEAKNKPLATRSNTMKPTFFGEFGGAYVAELLQGPLAELSQAVEGIRHDPLFWEELKTLQTHFVGRPTPLLHAKNAGRAVGANLYIKLEGYAHTGAHKINNALGQALLAKRMGKKRIIAETGAGQHGLATAAVCAALGLECVIYMGSEDVRRQRPNVFWMEMHGARVVPVTTGQKTLKDAVSEALRDWSGSYPDSHYLLGSALGPSPYPEMVHLFQSIIGKELEEQLTRESIKPHAIIACVGGGSNAIGCFSPFLKKEQPKLIGVEAGGTGTKPGEHAVRVAGHGKAGIAQGYKSLFLLDSEGMLQPTHSISAGLDYPGIGPELAHLGNTGRIEFTAATDKEALEAFQFFAKHEGILFALESAHAGAAALKLGKSLGSDKSLVIMMSGRGEKDLFITANALGGQSWKDFLDEELRHDG